MYLKNPELQIVEKWECFDRTHYILWKDNCGACRSRPRQRRCRRTSPELRAIPGKVGGEHIRNLNDPWEIVRARVGFGDVRLHDLRHSWASRALALGESLPVIGKLLGHSKMETTSRYAHLARDSAQEAAERVAASIAEDVL